MYRGLARHLLGQEGVGGVGTEEMEVVVSEVAMVVETAEDGVVR